MGLIKAAVGSVGGVLADQWREYFYCEALDADTLAAKGQKRTGNRSSNKHGEENIIDGIKNSCNFFFAEVGHRLATDPNGIYSQTLGLERIAKYAAAFGLDSLSGVEIDETKPHISDYDPERSAMGQGNHAYNNVQLARYITAVANRGTVFDLSILDKVTDSDGNVLRTIEPKVKDQLDFSTVTWNAVQTGLREMITEGVAKSVFLHQNIPIAGKTGTAQEREDRGNHAVFVSYAPYDNPEIAVTVNSTASGSRPMMPDAQEKSVS